MGQRFTITEEERNNISKMYGLVNEQSSNAKQVAGPFTQATTLYGEVGYYIYQDGSKFYIYMTNSEQKEPKLFDGRDFDNDDKGYGSLLDAKKKIEYLIATNPFELYDMGMKVYSNLGEQSDPTLRWDSLKSNIYLSHEEKENFARVMKSVLKRSSNGCFTVPGGWSWVSSDTIGHEYDHEGHESCYLCTRPRSTTSHDGKRDSQFLYFAIRGGCFNKPNGEGDANTSPTKVGEDEATTNNRATNVKSEFAKSGGTHKNEVLDFVNVNGETNVFEKPTADKEEAPYQVDRVKNEEYLHGIYEQVQSDDEIDPKIAACAMKVLDLKDYTKIPTCLKLAAKIMLFKKMPEFKDMQDGLKCAGELASIDQAPEKALEFFKCVYENITDDMENPLDKVKF